MRRLNILPSELHDHKERQAQPILQPLLSLTLDLEAITPIVGGGAETRIPDAVEPVRVPSIRGALRDWWRIVGEETDPDALYQNEAKLWGGVSGEDNKTGADQDKHTARASRVRLRIAEVVNPGRDAPAGYHRRTNRGRLGTLPDWRVGGRDDMGYALFPLQRSYEERRAAEGRSGDLPTPDIREKLRFKLHLEVVAYPQDRSSDRGAHDEGAADGDAERDALPDASVEWLEDTGIPRLMRALRAWILFGGLGARTTRGFGSLKLHGLSLDENRTSKTVRELMRRWVDTSKGAGLADLPRSSEKAALLNYFQSIGVAVSSRRDRAWPSLAGSTLLVGTPVRGNATNALQVVLHHLRDFRQGAGLGREPPGRDRRPGRSHWPEPDAMKLAWEAATGEDWTRELQNSRDQGHSIRNGAKLVAPRAAFGMPLNISFHYQHKFDQRADGHILPASSQPGAPLERFRSPVRLGVLPCGDGTFVPMVLFLNIERPNPVITFEDKKITQEGEKVSLDAPRGLGAQKTIRKFLATAGGDALKAWADFLAREKGFQRIVLGAKGGTR